MKPEFTENEAKAFLKTRFGLDTELRSLDSERDQNFLVKVLTPGYGEKHDCYVLKIANSATPELHLQFENEVLIHLANSPISHLIPQPQSSLEMRLVERATKGSSEHAIRLVDFIPGTVMAKVSPQTAELRLNLGQQLGLLSQSLSDFDSRKNDLPDRSNFFWNLDQAETTISRFQHELDDQSLLQPFLDNLHSRVVPKRESFRKSLIHNDANDHNLIVSSPSPIKRKIVGLIDFGDMVFGSTINELAIAVAYVMLDQVDPLAAAADTIQGFHQTFPLYDDEIGSVFDLACARLCTSVVMATHQQSLDPVNEYLSVTDQPARRTLRQLQTIHPEFAANYFRKVCGFPTHFSSTHPDRVRSWLEKNCSKFEPILDQHLDGENTIVLDLSVASSDALAGDLGSSTPDQLWARLSEKGRTYALGRYNEPRICYLGEQFSSDIQPENPAPETRSEKKTDEPRTIHMGVDLFAPAGTAIFAPLDGHVHSFADNDIPFDYGPTIILEHQVRDEDSKEQLLFYSLYGHLSKSSLNNLKIGQAISAGQPLAGMGTAEENGGWAPHLHFQVMTHDLGMTGNFPGVVKASELELWKDIIVDPYALLNFDRRLLPAVIEPTHSIISKRKQLLGSSLSLSYDVPLHMVRGRGQYLFDQAGHPYLDCVNNVCHVGHCHPKVVQAAAAQLGLLNTNTRYLHENIVRFSDELLKTLPYPLEVCFFVNSGSEANDLALRLARNFTQREEIICVDGGYHGNLSSLIDVSPYKYKSKGGSGKPSTVFEVPIPDSFRGLQITEKQDDQSLADFYTQYIDNAIQTSIENNSRPQNAETSQHNIAAWLCESILSCGGQIVLPENYLKQTYERCRNNGILCIADEVQVGFGRVGKKFWGFETQGVVPDIVTMGKPIGNGFPLGAVATTREIADAFDNGMEYFNTFGGNPVACAVGLAVLETIRNEKLQKNADQIGMYFLEQLNHLQSRFTTIGDARGIGLFLGIEFIDPSISPFSPNAALATYVVERMKTQHILLSTDGPDHNVIKIKPPLCFNRSDVDRVIDSLSAILKEDFPSSFAK